MKSVTNNNNNRTKIVQIGVNRSEGQHRLLASKICVNIFKKEQIPLRTRLHNTTTKLNNDIQREFDANSKHWKSVNKNPHSSQRVMIMNCEL